MSEKRKMKRRRSTVSAWDRERGTRDVRQTKRECRRRMSRLRTQRDTRTMTKRLREVRREENEGKEKRKTWHGSASEDTEGGKEESPSPPLQVWKNRVDERRGVSSAVPDPVAFEGHHEAREDIILTFHHMNDAVHIHVAVSDQHSAYKHLGLVFHVWERIARAGGGVNSSSIRLSIRKLIGDEKRRKRTDPLTTRTPLLPGTNKPLFLKVRVTYAGRRRKKVLNASDIVWTGAMKDQLHSQTGISFHGRQKATLEVVVVEVLNGSNLRLMQMARSGEKTKKTTLMLELRRLNNLWHSPITEIPRWVERSNWCSCRSSESSLRTSKLWRRQCTMAWEWVMILCFVR